MNEAVLYQFSGQVDRTVPAPSNQAGQLTVHVVLAWKSFIKYRRSYEKINEDRPKQVEDYTPLPTSIMKSIPRLSWLDYLHCLPPL
jgi:hypothetical protein